MIRPAVLCFAFAVVVSTAYGEDSNTVTVLGRRGEVEREERPGKSLVIRPDDPTRFDSKAQLAREASLTMPETGRVTAQGFAVPRVRGQDTRLTEVYVEDMLLQDSYSGLPLVDEIDLRAFGEMAIYQGTSPVSLPTLNSIGVLQYRVRRANVASSVGVTAGKPYGTAEWGLLRGDSELRVYARRHVTDGRFDYYSDNGTPYNSADDRHETRENNHRSSTQFMLYDHLRLNDDAKIKMLVLSQESRAGLPALNANLGSLAEQTARSRLANLQWEHALDEKLLSVRTSAHDDTRKTSDPSHAALAANDASGFHSNAISLGAALDLLPSPRFARLSYDHEESRARLADDGETRVKVRRATEKIGLGIALPVERLFFVEAKLLSLQLRDQISGDRRTTNTQGGSLAVELRRPWYSVYAQAGRSRRAASLLEEFGDGGSVLSASDITPEKAIHSELGVTAGPTDGSAHLGTSVFQDDTWDRITLVPALAGALRAQNIGRTRIRGIELTADAVIDTTRIYAGYTVLQPRDVTNADEPRRLPFVAERLATAGIEQKISRVTVREASRYQGRVYRDLSNSIVIPPYTVHDVSADADFPIGGRRVLALGLALLNATNVQKLAIQAPATAENDGATSYSDVTGYALPGRQWRFTASLNF